MEYYVCLIIVQSCPTARLLPASPTGVFLVPAVDLVNLTLTAMPVLPSDLILTIHLHSLQGVFLVQAVDLDNLVLIVEPALTILLLSHLGKVSQCVRSAPIGS